VLRPGGQFVMIVPFDDYRNSENRPWRAQDPDNHSYTWSPMNLGNLLQEVSFEVQKINLHIRAWSPKLFWIHQLFGKGAFKISCSLLGMYKRRQ